MHVDEKVDECKFLLVLAGGVSSSVKQRYNKLLHAVFIVPAVHVMED